MIKIESEELGSVELRSNPFVAVSWEISAQAARPVMRNRALGNGGVDRTRYVGGRVMTITAMINDARCDPNRVMQTYLDQIMPFTVANRFVTVSWSLPGTPEIRRKLRARGLGAPLSITRPTNPALIMSYESADGRITDAGGGVDGSGLNRETIIASEITEPGRTYNLVPSRVYPPSSGAGVRLLEVGGNEAADWRAVIPGAVSAPSLLINRVPITFAGYDVTVGHFIEINTRDRTILLDGDPALPIYDRSNFPQWVWDDLLFKPGTNEIRLSGTGASAVMFEWENTWSV